MRSRLLPVFLALAGCSRALAQPDPAPPAREDEQVKAPEVVAVEPPAPDARIRQRLLRIMRATPWFTAPEVAVDEGVVFLKGGARTDEAKRWAGELAAATQGVTAVVNQLEIERRPLWDLQPAAAALDEIAAGAMSSLPLLGASMLVFLVALLAARGAASLVRTTARGRMKSELLLDVAARGVALMFVVLGGYLALRIGGLTRLAVTVLGGTGLVGLVIGIAFRDIAENFLASILLSLQRPFRASDLVQVGEHLGIVQRLTPRSTILMSLSGNHVQIPNSTVYRSTIVNFSSNPNRREDFVIGIGYADGIPSAQEITLRVLLEHPAVLKDPEPWVLVDELGKATVNLRIYFWLDGSKHSWLKVRSSVIRLVKRALQDAGVSLPDEAREVVFPQGVPINVVEQPGPAVGPAPAPRERDATPPEREEVATPAEAKLESDAPCIEEQARDAAVPERGRDLLQSRS